MAVLSHGWLWWRSKDQGEGIAWTPSATRYFVSHGNGWIYLGVGETDSPGEGWAPWRWDTSIKGEHHRWFPPMDFLQKKSDYQFGICYWLLLVGHVVLWAGAAILWERRKRRVMDCQMLLSDDTSEASP